MPDDPNPVTTPVPASAAALRTVVDNALALVRQGRVAEALREADLVQQALLTIDLPQTRDGAASLNRLGMTLFEAGHTGAAESPYNRALAIAEQLTPTPNELVEGILNNLGQVHGRLGNVQRARALLERAVDMRGRRAPDTAALAVTLDNLGGVYARMGELGRAEEHHRRALAIFRRELGPLDTHVATALGNLSWIHMTRRELDRAEAFRLRALDTHARTRGLASPEALLDLHGLAAIYLLTGDETRVDRLVNHVLTIGGDTPGPEHRALATTLTELARITLGESRLDLAERLGTRAVEILDAIEGPAAADTLAAVHMLAIVQRATHDLDRAEQNCRRALDGFANLDNPEPAVTVSLELGKLYRERNEYQLAEVVLMDAVARIRAAATPDGGLLASALGSLAELYYESGRYELADETYAAALALPEAGADLERCWLLHGRGQLNYHVGRYDAARDLYEEARSGWIAAKGGDHPYVATVTANLALTHWARGDLDRALDAFEAAARRRDRDLRRVLAVGSERKRLQYATRSLEDLHKVLSFLFASAPAPAAVARFAAQLTLQRKGLVLDALAHTFVQVREKPAAEDQALLDRLQTLRIEIAGLVMPSPLARHAIRHTERLTHLREEEERLEAALSYRGALTGPHLEPVTLQAVQASVPPDAALIDIVQYRRFKPVRAGQSDAWAEERYAALVLRPTGEPSWNDLGPLDAIDVLGDRFRRTVRNRATPVGECERVASDLYTMLVAPLEKAIADATRLIVSPDGKLTMVPLGAMCDAHGRTLGRRTTMSYLTAGRDLRYTSTSPSSRSGVLVVAAPDYDAEAPAVADAVADRFADRGAFAPLAGARAEAADLAALLDSVVVIEGPDATVDAVRAVRHPAVLHIATHGFFAPVEPETVHASRHLSVGDVDVLIEQRTDVPVANPMFFSGLALAGANRRVAGAGTGLLTAQQIAGLDLRGTQLVVLSACETGLGVVGRGTEFTGMRRAVSIAGAASHVTSLWRVGDDATRALMGLFYRSLLDGLGRAEALAWAQEEVARDPAHPEWAHPFYWAAFVLSGAWTPMAGSLAPRPRPAPDDEQAGA
jgi:CHAT domain-containing protein/tetratricopeptide (TPR) repeat protein